MPRKIKASLIDGAVAQNSALSGLVQSDNQIKTLLIQDPGNSYTDGKYFNVSLCYPSGSYGKGDSCTADFVVKNSQVSKVILKKPGKNYNLGELLTAHFSTGNGVLIKVGSITGLLNNDAMKSERIAVGVQYPIAPLHVAGNALSSLPSTVQSSETTGMPTIADVMFSARSDDPYEIIDNSNHYGYESIISFNNKQGSISSNIIGFRALVYANETDENTSTKTYGSFSGAFRNSSLDKSFLTTNALFGSATYFGHNTSLLPDTTLTNDMVGNLIQGYALSGKITNLFGTSIRLNFANNASITNYIALHLMKPSQGIGVPKITNRWGVYQDDTLSKNYFAGNIGVGVTSATKAKIEISGGVSYKPSTVTSFKYINSTSTNIGSSNTTTSTATYSIWASNAIAASEFQAFSDIRLKKINYKITTDLAYKFINSVDSYSYSLKSDKNQDEKFGFIAQDLIKAGFSNLVGSYSDPESKEFIDKDGLKSPDGVTLTVNYEQIIPILTTAIKDLKNQIDELNKIIFNQFTSKSQ